MTEYNAIAIKAFDIDDPNALNHIELVVDDFAAIAITEYQARGLMENIKSVLQQRADNRTNAAIEAAEEMEYNRLNRLTVHNGTVTNIHQANQKIEGEPE